MEQKNVTDEKGQHHSRAVGETAWQLPRVQTVYGCNVTAIAISHSSSLVRAILVVLTKIVVQSAYTSVIERSLLKWNGRDCDGTQ